jgi:hypothetical protein
MDDTKLEVRWVYSRRSRASLVIVRFTPLRGPASNTYAISGSAALNFNIDVK